MGESEGVIGDEVLGLYTSGDQAPTNETKEP